MTRKGNTATAVWLGLFAMLMIHAGPLFSAVQALRAQSFVPGLTQAVDGHSHHPNAHAHGQAASRAPAASTVHHHHRSKTSSEPAWVSGLTLCGYCELLTLNPPLTLSLDLALPWYAPTFFEPLPEKPLQPAFRRGSGHPRAPPLFHV